MSIRDCGWKSTTVSFFESGDTEIAYEETEEAFLFEGTCGYAAECV